MAQEAMMMLAQSNLTGNDMKVMWAMLARLDYENLIQVNQAEVSEQVGMNRHNVNRSIKEADRAWRYPRGRQNRH